MAGPRALQYALSAREYEVLHDFLARRRVLKAKEEDGAGIKPYRDHDYNPAAFRSAFRLFIVAAGGLKAWDIVSARLLARGRPVKAVVKPPYLRSPSFRLALSLSSILYLHRVFFRFFLRLRLRLLSEKASQLRKRYPRLFEGMTSNLAPAVGASLAGLALGIYPADQLRITIAIYFGCRGLEFVYNALEGDGWFKGKPSWVGAWLLFPLAQAQLLHSFVFDRDCFPAVSQFPVEHFKC